MTPTVDSIARATSSTVTPASASSTQETGTGKETTTKSKVDPVQIASKDAFLKLLVAQIKNQNPLNPADGVQFLSQLAQFSELEQMIGMRQELESLHGDLTGAGTQAPSETGGSSAAA